MALNRDGLEPGQPVDFATHQRINRQRRAAPEESRDDAKPRRRKTTPETGDE